jgi:Asp-tRNA(Asn)/Glu-tRNA(Gln) amidotransferase A subunit family amidase
MLASSFRDPLNAFCPHSTATLKGAEAGPLAGLTFAAKDLFDIAGHVTGAGNPDWLALHAPAGRTAPVVAALVDAGADMVGKTHTDELSRGIFGENAHSLLEQRNRPQYGGRPNPYQRDAARAPTRSRFARPPSPFGGGIELKAHHSRNRHRAFRRALRRLH